MKNKLKIIEKRDKSGQVSWSWRQSKGRSISGKMQQRDRRQTDCE